MEHRVEHRRRSLLNALNSRWIYGRVPVSNLLFHLNHDQPKVTQDADFVFFTLQLLHSIIFLIEIAAMSLLLQKFNASYAKRPVV
jgi:hypothetical protein